LYYYEIAAEAKDDTDRQTEIDDMAAKVRRILATVEEHITGGLLLAPSSSVLNVMRNSLFCQIQISKLKALRDFVRLSRITAVSSALYDIALVDLCRSHQNLQNKLRAVLGHDGLFGRRQLHSFVKDRHLVEVCRYRCHGGMHSHLFSPIITSRPSIEVSEIVLTDSAGTHLGASPYLLIYSGVPPDDTAVASMQLPWPKPLKVGTGPL
jgi:hypothetical protein